jgi:hypothetical protein
MEEQQITITDLTNVIKIIDAASERGAFKGNELSSVGGVRDKIASFVELAEKQMAEASAETPTQGE